MILTVGVFVACENNEEIDIPTAILLDIPIITSISGTGLITWENVSYADGFELDINGEIIKNNINLLSTTTHRLCFLACCDNKSIK
ncbi:MAG: hypothetical protein FWE22_06720 [Firmicutes bacterium]|nr:hypothetical protein [Bacillota bacterium]